MLLYVYIWIKTFCNFNRWRRLWTQKKNIKRYSESAEALEKTYQKTNEIPTTKDITDNIDSLEELRELRILIHDTKEANKVVASQKKIGGK